MKLIHPFEADDAPELAQVGGKGLALILLTQHGLPVPPGFILSTAFFEPWIRTIKDSAEWEQVLDSTPETMKQSCTRVKELANGLLLDEMRKEALADALAGLGTSDGSPLYAVRSSAPEEDLEGASFAGGYETRLGVRPDCVEEAIRTAFTSCLDERVLVYKKKHGFAVEEPRIAVIVQAQVASDVSGVAFSLNPVNNSYDEAVITANYGLGESVVSGSVSPDTFVVDKVTRTILDRSIGSKETSIWLAPDGGTISGPSEDRLEPSLRDKELLALTEMLVDIERLFDMPVDIEWAISEGKIHLLQSRPITAYFPLPQDLRTEPGAPKKLYLDLTLTKWGMREPLSVLGTDFLGLVNAKFTRQMMGESVSDAGLGQMRRTLEGRTYLVISNSMKIQGKTRVANEMQEMDSITAEILRNVDEKEYVPDKVPPELKGIVFKMIRQNLGMLLKAFQAYRNPDEFNRRCDTAVAQVLEELEAEVQQPSSLGDFAVGVIDRLMAILDVLMGRLIAAEIARIRIRRLFKRDSKDVRDKLMYLQRALPGNITVEMGLRLHQLSRFEEIRDISSEDTFVTRLEARDLSDEFLQAWDRFMKDYGFRCPGEMDAGAVRFNEQPAEVFRQLRLLVKAENTQYDPKVIFEKAQTEREQAYRELLALARSKSKRKGRLFANLYKLLIAIGGYRETPKYFLSMITDMFRKKALESGAQWVQQGRLDHADQVFDLTLDQFDRARENRALDLRVLTEKNRQRFDKLARVPFLPRVVDSRGKILQPPKKEAREGELLGEAISPGTVRGAVKILNAPDEKPVLPGEILVARATDPGWTPLFLNAGGIILEVGGMLQHGALVAREYGKPCVSGIQAATEILHDGQIVELDGSNGSVLVV